MIYTATSLSPNDKATDRFQQYGAHNLGPARISEVRVTAFTAVKPATDTLVVIGCFYAFVAAAAMSAQIDMTIMVNLLSIAPPASFVNLFSLPQMAVSLRKRNEDAVGRLNALGFTQQSHGKYQFYTGPSTNEAIRDVVQINGVESDAYSPRGFASVHGILALLVINRILYFAFAAASRMTALTGEFDASKDPISGYNHGEHIQGHRLSGNIPSILLTGSFSPVPRPLATSFEGSRFS